MWTSVNPVLYDGEFGFEIDTRKMKIGNGTTAWNLLPYFVFDTIDISVEFIIDGGDAEITTGAKGDLEIPFNCTIQSAKILANVSGNTVIDILKTTYASFPSFTSITASAKPTLSSAQKYLDTTLTGWTTALTKGDILRFNVDSGNTIQRMTISLRVLKN